ncbi:DUF2382 domain-containing protein [Nostoc flagelliforme FACHB-838]|uniref:DUF2382 domain-containing protein n=1 Tax=Nostoc flagelliforme FACHB-838 TaxID=2692904 RepID=A0ABR8E7D1_9NOSO|nr:DUF2382 domain-containing protein [Nostoc flagelliforme FACHB-838]
MILAEEVADVQKEAFVREEVRVQKVIGKENVEVQQTVRRKELNVDSDTTPIVNKTNRDSSI